MTKNPSSPLLKKLLLGVSLLTIVLGISLCLLKENKSTSTETPEKIAPVIPEEIAPVIPKERKECQPSFIAQYASKWMTEKLAYVGNSLNCLGLGEYIAPESAGAVFIIAAVGVGAVAAAVI